MDFDISAEQQERLGVIDEIIETCGGIDRARSVAAAGAHDAELDAKLAGSDLLAAATALDRVLIAERLAELGVATAFGQRAVLTATGVEGLPDGPVAVVDGRRNGAVRFGSVARSVLVIGDAGVSVLELGADRQNPGRSSFGYPYLAPSELPTAAGRTVDVGIDELRRRWQLLLAAEISGAAAGGIAHTAAHLVDRTQFGRPLSSFQALRHRLAEAAVSAEAGRWLTREAAWSGDRRAATRAGWYVAGTAAALAPDLTQMCGARSFALEFGLHVFTMRLEGLRLEMGARDRLASELAESRHG